MVSVAVATSIAAITVGILIVAMGGIVAFLFAKFLMWWWDQNR